MAPDASEFSKATDGDFSFKFDSPEYKKAFDAIPNQHSDEMLALYLTYKIFGQELGISTADSIYSAYKNRWKMSDGDKYRGKWHFNTTSAAWEGNPADSAKVQDVRDAIKNKCGKDGGDRKHSLAMSEEFMTKIFEWSDKVCPPSSYDKKSTTLEEQALKTKHLGFKCFSSTSWTICCFELVKLQRKHMTFGLEDAQAFNTPYFELRLTNRKGWQKKINKTQKEGDLRSGKFKIPAQADLPAACNAHRWMIRWIRHLEEEIYGRPLQDDDYIFPAVGANGVVQTGEHICHDEVQKWISEFTAGAELPCGNGTFSTHCFRRGGAQYRFMFAPYGHRWTLRQVRWWGGWAEGEHRDTLIKYLLDELNTYEDDYSGLLLPAQKDTDHSFLGEASSMAPATTEHISLLHRSLSADIRSIEKLLHALTTGGTPGITNSLSAILRIDWSSPGSSSIPSIPPQHQTVSTAQPTAHNHSLLLSRPLIPMAITPGPTRPFDSFTHASTRAEVGTPSFSPVPKGRPIPTIGLVIPDVPVTGPDGEGPREKAVACRGVACLPWQCWRVPV
ncbi:hypothetical protein C8F04DRAFT_967990 [Mycena alexandri]|uniref:Tyr recombinase domain-containing protein n=1 Tax=Mycena alexandri TaxID=1745969 RepID=A0AAD6SCH5_9AGAR|nr:hypothetical protein C8F04DRAFT_967990 [Mycena alexandri]